MTHRTRPPRALLLAGLLALAGPAQAQEPGEQLCGNCKTSGRVPVDVSTRFAEQHDHGDSWEVLFCADALESDNMAMDWKPCDRCKTPSVQAKAEADYAAIRAANEAWLAERRKLDEVSGVKKPMAHVETTHFLLSWGVPKMTTVGKRTL